MKEQLKHVTMYHVGTESRVQTRRCETTDFQGSSNSLATATPLTTFLVTTWAPSAWVVLVYVTVCVSGGGRGGRVGGSILNMLTPARNQRIVAAILHLAPQCISHVSLNTAPPATSLMVDIWSSNMGLSVQALLPKNRSVRPENSEHQRNVMPRHFHIPPRPYQHWENHTQTQAMPPMIGQMMLNDMAVFHLASTGMLPGLLIQPDTI
mmetsp:Transcript_37433/g.81944  ORF Transcript_37433/g.81944 Transcript_37433/m.81944 type:complete len:208 (+) Transcript_37433:121-744(+)